VQRIRRRQRITPARCSHHSIFYIFLFGFVVTTPPIVLDCFATGQWVNRLSCSLQLLLICCGSSYVLRSTSFIRSSLRYIPPRSQLNILLPCLAAHYLLHKAWRSVQAQTLSQSCASACHTEPGEVLTGFHSASFVASSFQYCSVHLLPIIWLAGIPTFGCAQLANTNCSARSSHSQSIAKLRLHSSAASV
jgi:hypothetical protein